MLNFLLENEFDFDESVENWQHWKRENEENVEKTNRPAV